MRKICSFILVLISAIFSTKAQNVSIQGNIVSLEDMEVFFYYHTRVGEKIDTIKITSGKFNWSATIDGPQKVMIFLPEASIPFYIEPGVIHMDGKAGQLDSLKITGSKTHDEVKRFTREFRQLKEERKQLKAQFSATNGKTSKELVDKELLLNKKWLEKQLTYIRKNPESIISSSTTMEIAMNNGYNDGILAFNELSEKVRNSVRGKEMAEQLAILKRSRLGATIPDFVQNNPEGKSVHLADFKGKYVFIDFWASWCAPCRAENPNVLSAYNKFKDKNFTVIGVSLDSEREKWINAITEDQMPWTMVSDLNGMKNEISTYFGITGVPSTLLIDPSGKIIAKDLRGELLHQKLAEILL